MCLQYGFVIFWQKDFDAKAAHKMPVKLKPGIDGPSVDGTEDLLLGWGPLAPPGTQGLVETLKIEQKEQLKLEKHFEVLLLNLFCKLDRFDVIEKIVYCIKEA
jgi:hypothetical protein